MSKNIFNRNAKGQLHGYQERYWWDGSSYKCFYNNGVIIDYEENHCLYCQLEKSFYI